MARPNDLQKRVIEAVINEIKQWTVTNDINSPSHYTSLDYEMLSVLDEWDNSDDLGLDAKFKNIILSTRKLLNDIKELS